ncbi:MAG TPA: hypothetical protein VIT65_09660 [Microlunatus sp.]
MTTPVRSLDDFFPTYLALLQAGDADGLGLLYAEEAVFTSIGGPQGDSWSVGRAQIVAGLAEGLRDFQVVAETPPMTPFDIRGGTLAARLGIFEAKVRPRTGGAEIQLTVQAFEVLTLSPTAGWQYLSDQTQVLEITTTPPRQT